MNGMRSLLMLTSVVSCACHGVMLAINSETVAARLSIAGASKPLESSILRDYWTPVLFDCKMEMNGTIPGFAWKTQHCPALEFRISRCMMLLTGGCTLYRFLQITTPQQVCPLCFQPRSKWALCASWRSWRVENIRRQAGCGVAQHIE